MVHFSSLTDPWRAAVVAMLVTVVSYKKLGLNQPDKKAYQADNPILFARSTCHTFYDDSLSIFILFYGEMKKHVID